MYLAYLLYLIYYLYFTYINIDTERVCKSFLLWQVYWLFGRWQLSNVTQYNTSRTRLLRRSKLFIWVSLFTTLCPYTTTTSCSYSSLSYSTNYSSNNEVTEEWLLSRNTVSCCLLFGNKGIFQYIVKICMLRLWNYFTIP